MHSGWHGGVYACDNAPCLEILAVLTQQCVYTHALLLEWITRLMCLTACMLTVALHLSPHRRAHQLPLSNQSPVTHFSPVAPFCLQCGCKCVSCCKDVFQGNGTIVRECGP
eukprot:536258-Pelagomonas_calceolata.AAC.3